MKKRHNTKERSETRDVLQEGSGSQLRVSITVSHHSDWWLTVFATLQRIAKETNIKAQHVLDPWHDTFLSPADSSSFTQSNQCYIITRIYFSYFTLIKWHLLVVVRWCTSAPHVWWCHILHDEVNQILLKVGSCPLLGVSRTATSTLRGWLEGWGGERWR